MAMGLNIRARAISRTPSDSEPYKGYSFLEVFKLARGPNCTGLARARDGSWWVGNWDGSLLHYSADFATVVQEIRFEEELGLKWVGVKGVCIDHTTGVVYCADVLNNRIYGIIPSGPTLTYNFSLEGVNGLAFDKANNRLIASDDTATLKYVDKTTGTVTDAFAVESLVDHLFVTDTSLYVTHGNTLVRHDLATFVPVKSWSIDEASALDLEGIHYADGDIYLCDGVPYHNSGKKSRIVKLSIG